MNSNKNIVNKLSLKQNKSRPIYWVVFILLLSMFVLVFLEATGVTHIFREKPIQSGSQYTKGEVKSVKNKTPTDINSGSSGGVSKDRNTDSQSSLLAPSGDFVSNHHPNLSGSPAPALLTSVCNSTPGATCHIVFTSNGLSKTLPEQVIDPSGSTYWNNWSLKETGLGVGAWEVKAIVSLNGQTKSSTDALKIEVAK